MDQTRAIQEPQHSPKLTKRQQSTRSKPNAKERQSNYDQLTTNQEQRAVDYMLQAQIELQAKYKQQAETKKNYDKTTTD